MLMGFLFSKLHVNNLHLRWRESTRVESHESEVMRYAILRHAMVNRFLFRVPHNFAKFERAVKVISTTCDLPLMPYPFHINEFTVKQQSPFAV